MKYCIFMFSIAITFLLVAGCSEDHSLTKKEIYNKLLDSADKLTRELEILEYKLTTLVEKKDMFSQGVIIGNDVIMNSAISVKKYKKIIHTEYADFLKFENKLFQNVENYSGNTTAIKLADKFRRQRDEEIRANFTKSELVRGDLVIENYKKIEVTFNLYLKNIRETLYQAKNETKNNKTAFTQVNKNFVIYDSLAVNFVNWIKLIEQADKNLKEAISIKSDLEKKIKQIDIEISALPDNADKLYTRITRLIDESKKYR